MKLLFGGCDGGTVSDGDDGYYGNDGDDDNHDSNASSLHDGQANATDQSSLARGLFLPLPLLCALSSGTFT